MMTELLFRNYINICKKCDDIVVEGLLNDMSDNTDPLLMKLKYNNISLTDDDINNLNQLKSLFASNYKPKLLNIYQNYHNMNGGKGKRPNRSTRKNIKELGDNDDSDDVETPSIRQKKKSNLHRGITGIIGNKFKKKLNGSIDNIVEDLSSQILLEIENDTLSPHKLKTTIRNIVRENIMEIINIF